MNKQYESDQYWYTFNEVMKKSRLTTDADVRKTISKLRMIHMTKEFAVLIKQYIEFVKKKFKTVIKNIVLIRIYISNFCFINLNYKISWSTLSGQFRKCIFKKKEYKAKTNHITNY